MKTYRLLIARFWISKKAISIAAARAITRLARDWEIVRVEG